MAALLECAEEERLAHVHERAPLPEAPPLCPTLMHSFKLGGRKVQRSQSVGAVVKYNLASPCDLLTTHRLGA